MKAIGIVPRNHPPAFIVWTDGWTGFSVVLELRSGLCALIINIFYQNDSNTLAALRAYSRMKKTKTVKRMIRKFEVSRSVDVALIRGRSETERYSASCWQNSILFFFLFSLMETSATSSTQLIFEVSFRCVQQNRSYVSLSTASFILTTL